MATTTKDAVGKAGRPAADPENPRSGKIQTRISPAERERVDDCAAEIGVPIGSWVHMAIVEKLGRQEQRRERRARKVVADA